MYEQLKEKYIKGYISKETLRRWVDINRRLEGRGITEAQYEKITGESYRE